MKRNLRKEAPEYWLEVAQAEAETVRQDERKTVYSGFHTGTYPGIEEQIPEVEIVFEGTLRHPAEDGTKLLFPEITVQTFWTHRYERAEEVIRLYHEHGTSEQFHSELKSDLNIERLPSGKFAVNALLLQVAMMAFNTLRYLGQRSLEMEALLPYRTAAFRKRLRKVIDDLVRIAVKIVRHGRATYVKLWEKDPWLGCFRHLYGLCCSL